MYMYSLQVDSCLRDGEGDFLAVSYGPLLSVQKEGEEGGRRMRGKEGEEESGREGGSVV